MDAVAISIRGLEVRRGRTQVFDSFDLDLPRGTITGLLGPSGSGKTTLMRAIVGVQRVRSGTITVLGIPAGSAILRSRVAYATQSASVYSDLTVTENLHYFHSLSGGSALRPGEVLDATGLTPVAGQLVDTLSGGERSRVSLAAAMVTDPDVYILDEPTVGLDPVLRDHLWAIFTELAARGATLVISSHVLDEAMRCDGVVLLRDGRLLAQDSPAGLLRTTGATSPDEAFAHLVRSGA